MLGLLAGPIISLLVGFLKRIPFVAQHPKTVATILAAAATVVSLVPGVGGPLADIIQQLAAKVGEIAAVAIAAAVTTTVAVGTHEVAGNAVRATGLDPTAKTTSTPSPLQGIP